MKVRLSLKGQVFADAIYLIMIVVIVALFSVCSLTCFSQNRKIDSLKLQLAMKSGVDYSDVLYELAYELVDIDYVLGLEYATKSFESASLTSDSLRIVKAGRLKSLAFRRLGEVDSALQLSRKILPIAKRNNYSSEIKAILNGLGLAYNYQGNYDKALLYFFESLELRERDGDKFEISVALNNIGLVYLNLKDYDRALWYYMKVLKLKGLNDQNGLDVVLLNISLCYSNKKLFSEANNFIKQAFSLCAKNCSENFLSYAYFSLGAMSFDQGNFSEAEKQFLKSYELTKKLNNARLQLDNINGLLEIYMDRYQIPLIEKYLEEAEKLIALGLPYNAEIIAAYSKLFSFYEKSRDLKKVVFYQKKYISLKDSIYSEELTTNLMRVEAEHLEKENKIKIESQAKVLALHEEIIVRQNFLNIVIGIVAALLIVLTIVLIRSNRQKRIVNGLLDNKVKERTLELEINRDALRRACEERDIIIHKAAKDINSTLATIKGLCALGLKEANDDNAWDYLTKVDITSNNFSEILGKLFFASKTEVK